MERIKYEEMTPLRGNFAGRNSGGDTSVATSEGSITNSPKTKEYDTPPEHVNEAVSDPHAALTPKSGRSRGQLRASSLNINPSFTRAVNTSPSRRTSPKHLPQPIRTDTPSGIPIQLPGFSSLPNANDNLDAQPVEHAPSVGITRFPVSDFGNTALTAKHPRDVNPYLHRADEIGPTHRIAGVGHLGGALVPPGWKVGDEPINPERARELYNEARKAATDELDIPMSDEDDLSPEEREKRRKAIDRNWTATFKKDELVLKERIEIHKQYHLRKLSNERLRTLALAGTSTSIFDLPPQSPTPGQAQALKQNLQTGTLMPPPSPRATSIFGGQISPSGPGSTQAQVSLQRYPEAGTLDPALITESVTATLSRYKNQQEEILRKKNENEQMLSAFLTQYKADLMGPISPGVRSPVTGAAAGPFASVHKGYVPNGSQQINTRPLPYVSPTRPRFSKAGTFQPHTAGGPPPNMSAAELWRLMGCPKIPTGAEHPIYGTQPPSERNAWAPENTGNFSTAPPAEDNHVQLQVPPEKRKRAHRTKTTEKQPTWYAHQMVDLPTSQISAEAIAMGEAWKPSKGAAAKKTTAKAGAKKPSTPTKTPKKRGKVWDFDPAEGFPLDEKTAKSLLDRGLVKLSARSAPVPWSNKPPGPTITDDADPVPQSQISVTASGAAGLVDTSKLLTALEISSDEVVKADSCGASTTHNDDTIKHGTEAKVEGIVGQGHDIEGDDEKDEGSQSVSSLDDLDDPTDKSWGNRRKSTTPRKRKSTGQRPKRSRFGHDGANDSESEFSDPQYPRLHQHRDPVGH
ncbi:MAG: hypothetical protein M1835_001043 [Candelina submexicana]|nr:MAG: hypothetical protein M1835_001043 [Candelina submexicana]